MSGWCGSGGSALATAGERTSAAAQPNIAAPRRASWNFISTPLFMNPYSRFKALSKLWMRRVDEPIVYDARAAGGDTEIDLPRVATLIGQHDWVGLYSAPDIGGRPRICAHFRGGFLAEVARFRTDRQADAAHPLR